MRRFPWLMAAAWLAGCGGPAAAPVRSNAWVCENGSGFASEYEPSTHRLSVVIEGRRHVLLPQQAADGARYADDAYEFWERGPDARLTDLTAGFATGCREQ